MFSFGPGRVSCEPAPAQLCSAHTYFSALFFLLYYISLAPGQEREQEQEPAPDATPCRRRRLLFGYFMHERWRLNAADFQFGCFPLHSFPFLCFTSFSVLSSFNLISFHSLPLLPPLD